MNTLDTLYFSFTNIESIDANICLFRTLRSARATRYCSGEQSCTRLPSGEHRSDRSEEWLLVMPTRNNPTRSSAFNLGATRYIFVVFFELLTHP